jgi:hypothetical protein
MVYNEERNKFDGRRHRSLSSVHACLNNTFPITVSIKLEIEGFIIVHYKTSLINCVSILILRNEF